MRARHRADDVEGIIDVGYPIAHRLIERILKGLRAGLHRHHARAEQFHAVDVLHLADGILRSHVDHALHAVARRDRRGGHAVHAGAGLGDHARLAHPAGEHRLADGVVDLVRAGMVEILALEIDLRAAYSGRPALRVINRARAPDIVFEFVAEFRYELRILPVTLIRRAQLVQRMREGLGHERAAVRTEVPARVG